MHPYLRSLSAKMAPVWSPVISVVLLECGAHTVEWRLCASTLVPVLSLKSSSAHCSSTRTLMLTMSTPCSFLAATAALSAWLTTWRTAQKCARSQAQSRISSSTKRKTLWSSSLRTFSWFNSSLTWPKSSYLIAKSSSLSLVTLNSSTPSGLVKVWWQLSPVRVSFVSSTSRLMKTTICPWTRAPSRGSSSTTRSIPLASTQKSVSSVLAQGMVTSLCGSASRWAPRAQLMILAGRPCLLSRPATVLLLALPGVAVTAFWVPFKETVSWF